MIEQEVDWSKCDDVESVPGGRLVEEQDARPVLRRQLQQKPDRHFRVSIYTMKL
jgi:hypothetical protein